MKKSPLSTMLQLPAAFRATPAAGNLYARLARQASALLAMTVLTSCGRSDGSIQHDVWARLINDDATLRMKVAVTVEQGTVRLTGSARTRLQYERALAIAREVVDANHLVNDIRLDEHPLAGAVYTAMKQDPVVTAVPLEIEGFDGGVILRSNRTNEEQRTRILQIARRVPGVMSVRDYMK